MPRVVWTDEAVQDADELERFLLDKSPDAAVRAMLAIYEATDQLIQFPESGRPAEGRTPDERELLIPFGNAGYVLLYRVRPELVLVLGVKHMSEAGY